MSKATDDVAEVAHKAQVTFYNTAVWLTSWLYWGLGIYLGLLAGTWYAVSSYLSDLWTDFTLVLQGKHVPLRGHPPSPPIATAPLRVLAPEPAGASSATNYARPAAGLTTVAPGIKTVPPPPKIPPPAGTTIRQAVA